MWGRLSFPYSLLSLRPEMLLLPLLYLGGGENILTGLFLAKSVGGSWSSAMFCSNRVTQSHPGLVQSLDRIPLSSIIGLWSQGSTPSQLSLCVKLCDPSLSAVTRCHISLAKSVPRSLPPIAILQDNPLKHQFKC